MKKKTFKFAIMAFVMVLASFVLVACSNGAGAEGFEVFQNTVYSHLVIKDGNKRVENFRLNYSAAVWESEQQKNQFLEDVQIFYENFETTLNENYKQILEDNEIEEDLILQKFTSISHENNNLILVASFSNENVWKVISNKDGLLASKNNDVEFFYYTVNETVEKLGSVIKNGGIDYFVGDFFRQELFAFLQDEGYQNVLDANVVTNVFGYATQDRSVKTNSDATVVVEGKYFHLWNITDAVAPQLTFSITYPRYEVWYFTGIALGLLSLSAMFFISYFIGEKKLKKTADAETEIEDEEKSEFLEEINKLINQAKESNALQTEENNVLQTQEKTKRVLAKKVQNKNTGETNKVPESTQEGKETEKANEKVVSKKAPAPRKAKQDKSQVPQQTSKEKPKTANAKKSDEVEQPKARRKTTKKED